MEHISIDTEKQNVYAFLKQGNRHKFVVPAYQRKYSWTVDQVTGISISMDILYKRLK